MSDEEGVTFASPNLQSPYVTLSGEPVYFAEVGDTYPFRTASGIPVVFTAPGDGFTTPLHTFHPELIAGVDADFIRFCPIHRLPHDADPTHYFGAGRLCPAAGEPLRGYLTRVRDQDGTPQMDYPEWWGPEG